MFYIVSLVVVSVLVSIDQWSKAWTVSNLKNNIDITLLEGIFKLTYVENRGAAFGLLQNKLWIFATFTIIVLVGMIYIYAVLPKIKKYTPLRVVMVILFSGALGNFIDRIRMGYVVDMFHFYVFEFPVFNVADMYVVVSCVILMLLMLFYYKEEDLDLIKVVRKKNEHS